MDFFEAQDKARRQTTRLVLLFAGAVVLIVATVYLAVSAGFMLYDHYQDAASRHHGWWSPMRFVMTTLLTTLLIGMGSLYKLLSLREGGAAVISMLGGRRVTGSCRHPEHRRLYNIIEEMSIASGVPLPEVFVLEREYGINALTAGHTFEDAALAVTAGALQALDRDELQGVIAHEYSHILHGDMRLNTRLIGVLHGIMMLTLLGRIISELFSSDDEGSMRGGVRIGRGSFGRAGGGGAAPLILAIMVVMALVTAIGYIGSFFGRLIQSAVLRRRELLADAAAIQFTRNPQAVAGALKKVGGLYNGGYIRGAHSEELAHLFFAHALWRSPRKRRHMHPPLDQRIRCIEPRWNGRFPSVKRPMPESHAQPAHAATAAARKATSRAAAQTNLHALNTERSRAALERLPRPLREAAHETAQAQELVLAILLSPDAPARADQIAFLNEDNETIDAAMADVLYGQIAPLSTGDRLVLVEIALPALSRMTSLEFRDYSNYVDTLIRWDHQTTAFEFLVRHHIIRQVGRGTRALPADLGQVSYTRLGPIKEQVGLALSLLAREGAPGPEEAVRKLAEAIKTSYLLNGQIEYVQVEEIDFEAGDRALHALSHAAFAIRRHVIDAAARCVKLDQAPTDTELGLVRVFALALGCPMPK